MKHCVTISAVLQTAVRQTDGRQTVRHTNTFLEVDWFSTIDLITLWVVTDTLIPHIFSSYLPPSHHKFLIVLHSEKYCEKDFSNMRSCSESPI